MILIPHTVRIGKNCRLHLSEWNKKNGKISNLVMTKREMFFYLLRTSGKKNIRDFLTHLTQGVDCS